MKIEELACTSCGAPLSGDFSLGQQIECASCGSVFVARESEPETETTIICPKCQSASTIEERFCTNCGQTLRVDCILCHTKNTIGTVHCTNCGAHLEKARAKRKKMQEKRRKIQEERNRAFKEKEAKQQEIKLQQLLDDLDEPENHDFAIYQINRMGADAVEALIETLLHDTDPDARYGSARALGQICNAHNVKGLIKARVSKSLISALNDSEPAVRYWSANALGKCRGKIAVEPLANLLGDNHQGVRLQAERALERIGGQQAEEILDKREQKEKTGIFRWIKKD